MEIDGALIEVYRAMGVFVGTAFILGIAVLVAGLFRTAPAAGSDVYYDRAIVLALFAQFPIGTVHVGDPGGAEFKMMAIAGTMRDSAEVLLLQHGSLEALLSAAGIRHSVQPLADGTRKVRREGGFTSLLRALPGSLAMVRHIARRARHFDRVVCFSQKAFVLASLAKPFMRRPIFWFMNDILSADHFHPTMIRMLIGLSRFSANGVAVVSQESLNQWLRVGGRRDGVSVVVSGIDPAQVARQLGEPARVTDYRRRFSPDGSPLIGVFGRICRWKGQDLFLRALQGG